MMSSAAAFSRPPAHPGAEPENPHSGAAHSGAAHSGAAHSGAAHSGAAHSGHVPGLDPGLAHPQLMSRPVFYVHAPPPPFMHYQWPMPFYNPFNPFSGMGYGMMMPPFPPVPYMEPPTYFLPHAPVQPVDPRRMVQPHPNATPHQNLNQTLNQTRRPRPPHAGRLRETVNTEVQTEARGEFHGGSPLRSCSDSGRETALTSPTSSTSSQKRSNCDMENCNEPKEGSQHQREPFPERQSVQKTSKESCLVPSPSLKHCKAHLVRQENVSAVNSPAKEMSEKERRVSVPDVLLRWGNEDKATDDRNEILPPYEDEVEHFQSSTVVNEEQLESETVDGENKVAESKLLCEPLERSLNTSVKLCNPRKDIIDDQTLEEPSNAKMASVNVSKKLNESIWSVESLPIYVPTKEWLAQNLTGVILESPEEMENCPQGDEAANERSHNSSDSVQLSNSFIDFSTPAKTNEMNGKRACDVTNEPKKYKMQECLLALDSPICKPGKLPENCTEAIMSEAPEPVQSPKRLSFTIEEKLEGQHANKDSTRMESEKAGGDEPPQKEVSEGAAEQLLAPPRTAMEPSPSKGHLVDCGVQCPELQATNAGRNCRPNFYTSDVHNSSTRSEGSVMNGHWQKKRHNQSRNKGQYRPHSQQDVYFDFFNKPGKQRGGKGRY